jgi:hypothetical protein
VGTAGVELTTLVIGGYDTRNGGVPFGVIAEDYGTITLAGYRVPISHLPDDYGDCHIWMV